MQTKSAHNLKTIFDANLIVFNVLNLGLLCNLLERERERERDREIDLNLQRYKRYSIAQTVVIACLSLLLKTFFRQLSVWKKFFLCVPAIPLWRGQGEEFGFTGEPQLGVKMECLINIIY